MSRSHTRDSAELELYTSDNPCMIRRVIPIMLVSRATCPFSFNYLMLFRCKTGPLYSIEVLAERYILMCDVCQ